MHIKFSNQSQIIFINNPIMNDISINKEIVSGFNAIDTINNIIPIIINIKYTIAGIHKFDKNSIIIN
jgi:hypothetical protein